MAISRQQVQKIRIMTILMHKISHQAMQQRFAEEGIDLTRLQYGIMSMAKMNSLTITDLSRKMGLDPSTLVPSVDALVKKGYISRERDPNDRRRYPLSPTESGTKLLKRLHDNFGSDPLPTALGQLKSAELEQLQDLLRKVVMNLPNGESALEEMEAQWKLHDEFMES